MNRLATFLLVFVIALSLIASSSCGRQGNWRPKLYHAMDTYFLKGNFKGKDWAPDYDNCRHFIS